MDQVIAEPQVVSKSNLTSTVIGAALRVSVDDDLRFFPLLVGELFCSPGDLEAQTGPPPG